MSTTSSPIPFTGYPFPKSEYQKRQENVLKAMERAKLDALLVTAHHHLRYLTGYNGQGGYFRPFPLILAPGRAPTYVVREYDELAVRAESCIENIIPYTHQVDFAKVCGDLLRQYGLQAGTIGLQLGCWNLAPADVSALQAQLPEMKVADATRLVPSLMAVKSELELQVMRDAMAMTDVAVRTFQTSLRDGISEVEIARIIAEEVSRAGGELWTSSTNILFGERTKLPHGLPTRHSIKNNEPAFMEIGGAKYGYASGIVRCAVLGRHPETEALHALSVEALEAALTAIKSGVTAESVDAAARNVVERSKRSRAFRHRTGYQTGIHWGGRGNLSLEPGAKDILEAGMTLHMPVILFGESGRLIGCSEQVLVTDRGAEILGNTQHTLFCK
ncbi:M24 family metallopeptidase [Bradyrhizobium sp. USDA 223]|uniref:M24 family metallopeptidase n=1 Tax=Bradyrhizobium sp. USDA 223 TaxID=3156306 RepID=UPI0038392B08